MKSQILAALVGFFITSAPALAIDFGFVGTVGGSATASSSQNSDLSVGLGANATVTTGGTMSGLTANASATASLAQGNELSVVIGLIESSNWTENSLSGVVDVNAKAYDVSAWINSENQAAFEAALSANAGEIEDLQAAVSGNAAFDAWLEASNAEASEVIAIGVAADGSLAVFTN